MATNPYVNKVQFGNTTVMDISDSDVTESDVVSGKTFYKASGAKSTGSAVIPSIANCYETTDTAETTIDDADYFPFYDSSASGKRKSLWSNIKAKLKTYFDTLYSTYAGVEGLIKSTVGWSVKNILDCDITSGSHTQNGITLYVSRYVDGSLASISVNGTATADTTIEIASSVTDGDYNELTGNTYILSGCAAGGSDSTYYLYLEGLYGSEYKDTGSGVLISNLVRNGKLYIVVKSGYTASNLMFYPMIRNKNVTDNTYVGHYDNVKSILDQKADSSDIDDWIKTESVSNGSITFTGINDTTSYGYDVYVDITSSSTNKSPYAKLTTVTNSGTSSMTLVYETDADNGATAKLRRIK